MTSAKHSQGTTQPTMTFDQASKAVYLYLAAHPGLGTAGCVKRTIELRNLLPYMGQNVNFDFDENDVLIGIEVY